MRIVDSARKHGIEDADIWHAIRNVINPGFERGDLLMLLGPARNGSLIEVGILGAGGDDAVVIHAMKMRPRFQKYL